MMLNMFLFFVKIMEEQVMKNKYDLPPPLDKKLYYGSLLIIKHDTKELNNENVLDFSVKEWLELYERLFGGFEDLNDDDSYSEEEEIPAHLKTKEGYSKEDGFIVSDNEEDNDEDYIPDEDVNEIVGDEETTEEDEAEDNMGHDSETEEDISEEDEDEDDDEEDYNSDELDSELSESDYVDSD